MSGKNSSDKRSRNGSNPALIARRAAGKRSAINEHQAQHLLTLARCMTEAAIFQWEVDSVADLPQDGWEAFTDLQEYELFVLGAYACGFVCSDLIPNADMNLITSRPHEALREMSLPQIRHFVHTLMRSERAGHGYGSVIYGALRAGVFEALCERLEYGSDLYESL